MGSIQCLSVGQDITERVVVVRGAYGHVGQCHELCVVPAAVEANGGVGLAGIDLVLAAWGQEVRRRGRERMEDGKNVKPTDSAVCQTHAQPRSPRLPPVFLLSPSLTADLGILYLHCRERQSRQFSSINHTHTFHKS